MTAGGLVLEGAAVAGCSDPPGRVILAFVALGLLVTAGSAGVRRPRLAVDYTPEQDPRLAVRGFRKTEWYSRCDIVGGRSNRMRRLGRSTTVLELDIVSAEAERLLVFGWWDLGVAPAEVCRTLIGQGLIDDND